MTEQDISPFKALDFIRDNASEYAQAKITNETPARCAGAFVSWHDQQGYRSYAWHRQCDGENPCLQHFAGVECR